MDHSNEQMSSSTAFARSPSPTPTSLLSTRRPRRSRLRPTFVDHQVPGPSTSATRQCAPTSRNHPTAVDDVHTDDADANSPPLFESEYANVGDIAAGRRSLPTVRTSASVVPPDDARSSTSSPSVAAAHMGASPPYRPAMRHDPDADINERQAEIAEMVAGMLHVIINEVLFQRGVYPVEAFQIEHHWDVLCHICRHPTVICYLSDVQRLVKRYYARRRLDRILVNVLDDQPISELGRDDGTPPVRYLKDTVFERHVIQLAYLRPGLSVPDEDLIASAGMVEEHLARTIKNIQNPPAHLKRLDPSLDLTFMVNLNIFGFKGHHRHSTIPTDEDLYLIDDSHSGGNDEKFGGNDERLGGNRVDLDDFEDMARLEFGKVIVPINSFECPLFKICLHSECLVND